MRLLNLNRKNYISGMKREEYTEKHHNGLVKSAGVLVNNVKIGSWSYWYDNGILEDVELNKKIVAINTTIILFIFIRNIPT